ncbi:probable L-type lectin-domain containing receptor kinase S.5 [Carya illinoinensis]|uniref:probable L-type lectin-domain containing receptor kinase S.5 n=1 Tax=Carya illinoinensis TaxID=32201 RepID=UPI001C71B1E1|nr:probable L-type lectin-domain containing receptor kinase S.5 [Carya illinoinensis]
MGILSNGSSIALAIILFSLLHLAAEIQTTAALMVEKNKFSFDEGFHQTAIDDYFKFEGKAGIGLGALQITPDTANDAYSLFNTSGRIMFSRPFRLWSDDSQASFNSTFVINIFRIKAENWTVGQGLAFLIAPNTSMPAASEREWLGLTNEDTDGNSTNQIVAIEFDTQKQVYDPDDNHIGLDINSVKSNTSVSLDDHGIRLSPEDATNYSVWVDYNGSSMLMEVYMVKEGEPKPRFPLLNETINLKEYVKDESYFGFAASTGYPNIQLNCVLKWSLWVQDLPEKRDLTWLKIGAGVGVPAVILLILLGVIYVNKRKRSRVEESNVFDEQLKSLPGMPREFKYREIKEATNNFHESMKLGEGGFGIVYRGILNLKDHNTDVTEIAVKQFVRDNIKSKDDFLAELTIIHRLRHRHLVRLVGWCYDEGKLLLLYDFMPNGSLDKHLYDASNRKTLNWERRQRILVGVASALHYLHNDYDQTVVHRDLKASNILLDSEYNARLGDFGLARALDNDKNSYAELGLGGVAGTMGYVAPECFHTGRATAESDVFSFGAVVLEVVCGRSPGIPIRYHQHEHCSLVDWVWIFHSKGSIQEAVDERLSNNYVVDEAKRLLLLGLACSHPVASERPRTQAIYQIITGAMPPPLVPPFKPVFTWPLMGTPYSNTESTTSTTTVSCKGCSDTNMKSNIQMSSSTSQSFKSVSPCTP